MNLIKAIESSIELELTNQNIFEGILSGHYLNSIGKSLKEEKEYLCLIDMEKRKITVLGENPR